MHHAHGGGRAAWKNCRVVPTNWILRASLSSVSTLALSGNPFLASKSPTWFLLLATKAPNQHACNVRFWDPAFWVVSWIAYMLWSPLLANPRAQCVLQNLSCPPQASILNYAEKRKKSNSSHPTLLFPKNMRKNREQDMNVFSLELPLTTAKQNYLFFEIYN